MRGSRLDRLVGEVFAAFDVDAAMADIHALADLDRLQASRGIEQAAERVAERAIDAGCDGVEVIRFPADGQVHWWSFRAPRAYTPVRASLELVANGSPPLAAYPDVACSLAAYSAAADVTAPLVRYGSGREPHGAIAVINDTPSLPLAIEHAERAGAVGVVSDLTSRHLPAGHSGRIELPIDTRLFGFSISPAAMASALAAADSGGLARATVVLADDDACMPVVTATIGGEATDEVWLQAHLCHRSPGANDNLSGVAALLGIARAARAVQHTGRVRFVWMPEFVGTAAYLHRVVGDGKLPVASIDLDMVGEDQRQCGGPLIVERSPDHHPHFLNAVVEHALDALPDRTRSYSGAVAVRTWTWQATPFVGASDHALFADRGIGVPAVQLGHWPDRFNHSSADTIDKVDGDELRRAATVAGAAALFLSSVERHDEASLEDIVFRWGRRRIGEADSPATLAHARDVALASLAASSGSERSERLRSRLSDHADAHAELVGGHAAVEPASQDEPTLQRRWPGPFNLRAVLEASDERTWLLERMAQDRATFPAATALALAIDDSSGRGAVIARATVSSGLTIDADFADRFLKCLIDVGWVEEGVACR